MHVWKTVKIFVSSTFKDLETERDQFAKIFKNIQQKLFERKIHLVLYDLRWQERHDQDLVSWCLDLVEKSHYFAGILANRYGWCPPRDAKGNINEEEISITEMEIRVALAHIPQKNRLFYFNNTEETPGKMKELKSFLTQNDENIYKYDDASILQNKIEQDLFALLNQDYLLQDEDLVEKYTYIEALHDIIETKAQGFVGRIKYLQQLSQFIEGKDQFCILTGIAGQGKSSLVAQFSREYTKRFSGTALLHFASMTTDSNTFFSLLKSLHVQLEKHQLVTESFETTSPALATHIIESIAKISTPVLIIIDGVDEFLHQEKLNSFLGTLSENVKVILTTRFLWQIPFRYQQIELTNLTQDEINKIIYIYQKEYDFTLPQKDIEILNKRANGNPLFLKVALDETANEGISIGQMAESIDQLFSQIVVRLQQKHGKDLVDMFLGVVGASRYGIMEAEMYEIINNTFQLPISDIILLQKSLQSFVVEKRKILHFFHPEFERSIKMLIGRKQMRLCHQVLAQYFSQKRWNYQRSLSELPYQLLWGEMYPEVLKLYTDIDFLKAKCKEGLLGELMEDFNHTLQNEAVPIPTDLQVTLDENKNVVVSKETIQLLQRAIEMDLQFIYEHPYRLFQCLWNRGYWHDAPQVAEHYKNKTATANNSFFALVNYWHDPQKKYSWLKALRPLPERIDSPLEKQLQSPDIVWALAKHPEENLLAVGLQNKKVQIWDLATGELAHVWEHNDAVWALEYNQHGKKMVTASGQNLRIWDVSSGEIIVTLSGHTRPITSAVFTKKGDKIISASEDATIKIWDIHTYQCLRTLQGHAGSIWRIKVSDSQIFSASEDKTIKIWDLDTGSCIETLQGHTESVQDIALGKNILVSAGDKTVRLWSVEEKKCIAVLEGHEKDVYSVAIDSEDTWIISGSYDNSLKVWEAETHKCSATYLHHQNFITSILVDKNNIISGCYDKYVRIWNLDAAKTNYELEEHKSKIKSIQVCPKEEIVATGSVGGEIKLWDIKTGILLATLHGHEDDVVCFAFTKNNTLISGSWDGNICLWDLQNKKLIHTIAAHQRMIETIFLSQDEKILASAGTDQEVLLWNMENYQCLQSFRGHNATIRHLSLSKDNKILVSADINFKIRIWNIAEKRFVSINLQDKAKIDKITISDNYDVTAFFSNGEIEGWNLEGKTIIDTTEIQEQKYQKEMFHVNLYHATWTSNGILIGSHNKHLFILQLENIIGEC